MKLTFENVSLRLGATTLEIDGTFDQPVSALFGPSGSGKTSLLELAAGLRRPDRGRILLGGTVLADIENRIFVPARKRLIGYVPQDLALFPHLTVRQNISYGAREPDPTSSTKLLATLDLEKLLDRRPATLSGGEKQRVAFARALLAAPRMLLLDEPLASLDKALKDQILSHLNRLRTEFAIPMLYVTHSAAEVMALADEVILLKNGRVSGRGTPRRLFVPSEATVTWTLAHPEETAKNPE